MSGWRDPQLNYVTVRHGPPCGGAHCRAALGDVLTETWNRGKASVDLEWQVSKKRVDDPDDHAGSCSRLGPDVAGEFSYPPFASCRPDAPQVPHGREAGAS